MAKVDKHRQNLGEAIVYSQQSGKGFRAISRCFGVTQSLSLQRKHIHKFKVPTKLKVRLCNVQRNWETQGSILQVLGPTAIDFNIKLWYGLFWNFQNKLHLTDFQQLRKGGVAADFP
ncbi:hypothetical protein XENORESO_012457 [Xenotaenia resolanae]|uniref:HTH psq-type domain-containing protein n=1 Tax=Xenotaenia resolanae TaxID=208358 RepID=A0ABV0WM48_9TELE